MARFKHFYNFCHLGGSIGHIPTRRSRITGHEMAGAAISTLRSAEGQGTAWAATDHGTSGGESPATRDHRIRTRKTYNGPAHPPPGQREHGTRNGRSRIVETAAANRRKHMTANLPQEGPIAARHVEGATRPDTGHAMADHGSRNRPRRIAGNT